MKHLAPIAWFEIVTKDIDRAVRFYEAVFNIKLNREVIDCEVAGEMHMACFPYPEGQTGGALVAGTMYEKTDHGQGGSIIYLTTDEVTKTLAKIEELGGKIVFPSTSIGPNGYIGGFIDSEDNFVGLWSMIA